MSHFISSHHVRGYQILGALFLFVGLFFLTGAGYSQYTPILYATGNTPHLDSSTYSCDQCITNDDCPYGGMGCQNGVCLPMFLNACTTSDDCFGSGTYQFTPTEVGYNADTGGDPDWVVTYAANDMRCNTTGGGGLANKCILGAGSSYGGYNVDICTCGNGALEDDYSNLLMNEECDDGNVTNGDGCSSSCKIELPVLDTNDPSATEGVGNSLVFQFTLSDPAPSQVSFNVGISPTSTASGGVDYDNTFDSWLGVIATGDTTYTITIPLYDDAVFENLESVNLLYFDLQGGATGNNDYNTLGYDLANGDIADNEATPTVNIGNATGNEGTTLYFPITLTPIASFPIQIEISTQDITAIAPGDYISQTAQTVTIPPMTGASYGITLNTDGLSETTESFELQITNTSGGVTTGTNGVGYILDIPEGTGGNECELYEYSITLPTSGWVFTYSYLSGLGDPHGPLTGYDYIGIEDLIIDGAPLGLPAGGWGTGNWHHWGWMWRYPLYVLPYNGPGYETGELRNELGDFIADVQVEFPDATISITTGVNELTISLTTAWSGLLQLLYLDHERYYNNGVWPEDGEGNPLYFRGLTGTFNSICVDTGSVDCGTALLNTYYQGTSPTSGDLCSGGVASGFVYTPNIGWNWECGVVSCNAYESYCGDGAVGTGIGYVAQEQCDTTDLGTGTCIALGFSGGTLGCDASCQWVTTGCVGPTSGIDCNELNMELVLTDLGYPRINPFIDEPFALQWTQPTDPDLFITSVLFGTSSISSGASPYALVDGLSTTGVTNLLIDLENTSTSATGSCVLPVDIVAYSHQKNAQVAQFNPVAGTYIITYQVESSLPFGFPQIGLTDEVQVGSGLGYIDIDLNSLQVRDASGNTVSDDFALTGSLLPMTGSVEIDNATYNYVNGFAATVAPLDPGNYGTFTLVYNATVITSGDQICNSCISEANGSTGGGSTTFWFDLVYAQGDTYFATGEVCIEISSFTGPTCNAAPSGYLPCPTKWEPNPSGGTGQAYTLLNAFSECGTSPAEYCVYYRNQTTPVDYCTGPVPLNTRICRGAQIGSGTQYYSPAKDLSTAIDPTLCPEQDLPPGDSPACSYVCADGALFVNGSCQFPSCGDLPDPVSWPEGVVDVVSCLEEPVTVDEPYVWQMDEEDCEDETQGCRYYYDCGFGFAWVGTETVGTCERVLDARKTALGIMGSTGQYRLEISLSSGATSFSFVDSLLVADQPFGNIANNVQVVSGENVDTSSMSCVYLITNKSIECTGFTITGLTGGALTLLLDATLFRGGDEELCNSFTVTQQPDNEQEQSNTACLSGYNISVTKEPLTGYDSNYGAPGINTYPSGDITLGMLYDGDWVVYEIVARNNGPQDAWSPTITDTLPPGLTVIDFITGYTNGIGSYTVTPPTLTGSSQFIVEMTGLFPVGSTYTMRFSARFDQDIRPFAAGEEMCNEVEFWGLTEDNELSVINNTDEACLQVPPCGPRQCQGEIYLIDKFEQITANSYTLTGTCQVEGNCQMAGTVPTSTVNLTYTTCTGTYTLSGSQITYLSTYFSGAQKVVLQPFPQSSIGTVLSDLLKDENGFQRVNTGNITMNNGIITYECRLGSPYLMCGKQTCDEANTFSQVWMVGGPAWTGLNDLPATAPVTGSQGSGQGVLTDFTCNTCNSTGTGEEVTLCPEGQAPIVSMSGQVSCGNCLACGCCINGEDITVEYAYTGINGQTGYQVIDIFCPEDPFAPPYPNRNYDIYPATDSDGDGHPDACILYEKNIVSMSGNTITYQVTAYVSSGTSMTFVDSLSSGAYFIPPTVLLPSSQGTGTLQTNYTNNNTVMGMLFTNTGSGMRIADARYMVGVVTGGIVSPVCNDLTQMSGGNPVGEGEEICDCPLGWDFCEQQMSCVPPGQPCTETDGSGSVCNDLITTVTQTGIAYQCLGSGLSYQVTLTSGNQLLQTRTTPTGSFPLLPQATGTYTVTCAVDGDTGVMCDGAPISCYEIHAAILAIQQQLINMSSYFGQISWTGFAVANPCENYYNLSLSGLVSELSTDLYAYFLSQIVILYPPAPNSSLPSGVLTNLQQMIYNVAIQQFSSCTEACVDTIIFSGGPYCGDGHIDPGEQCDPPGVGSCRSDCTFPGGGSSSTTITDPPTSNPTTTSTPTTSNPTTTSTPTTSNPTTTSTSTTSNTTSSTNTNGGSSGGGRNDGTCVKSGVFDAKYCVKSEPKCTEIDPPSVMVGEYLPFWWDLELGNEVDTNASSCTDLDAGKFIPGASLLCTFEIYNGASPNGPVYKIERIPCLQDAWKNPGITLFDDMKGGSALGRIGSNWIHLTSTITRGIVGEYQIVLSSIDYTVCENKTASTRTYKGSSANRVCAMNFGVAEPYLLHQGSRFSLLQETNLRSYRKVDGRAVLSRDALRRIQQSITAAYPGTQIQSIFSTWINKQYLRAQEKGSLTTLTTAFLKKVPSERIYVYDGGTQRDPLILRGGDSVMQPLTLIVRNADLIIEGSLRGKNMYLVPDGKVAFKNTNCDMKDVVEGIFMTTQGVMTTTIRNDSLSSPHWCNDGRLVIEGILVSPEVNASFIDSRRAVLDNWFDITEVTQEQKVFDAASVLLKSTPSEWKLLPPGANALLRNILVGLPAQ